MVEDQEEYYLPDIIKDVVERVNQFFENRVVDPFAVEYDHGLYEQVGNDRLKGGKDSVAAFFLVWLVMPFDEDSPKDESYSSDVNCRLIIAAKTDSNYTMAQRESVNFFPRLIPIMNRIIYELQMEQKLDNMNNVSYKKRLLPYWGGGDVNAPGQNNLWKNNADCIDLSNIKMKKENKKDCTSFTNM